MPRTAHSNTELAEVAALSWCMADFLVRLGEENSALNRHAMWRRLRRIGVDTSHWDTSPRRWYSDDQLAAAAALSMSYAECLRALQVPVTGGQHAHLARRIRRAGIDTSHFLGQAHNRGRQKPCKDPLRILRVLPAGSDRPKTAPLRRAMAAAGVPAVCAECGCGQTWRGRRLVLLIDHISGDWLDNRLINLRFLCPNCHSQTSTWCRKQKKAPTKYDAAAAQARVV